MNKMKKEKTKKPRSKESSGEMMTEWKNENWPKERKKDEIMTPPKKKRKAEIMNKGMKGRNKEKRKDGIKTNRKKGLKKKKERNISQNK